MKLSNLKRSYWRILSGHVDQREIHAIETDSRAVRPGSLFVALAGTLHDGHRFVEEAVSKGAAAVWVQEPVSVPVNSDVVLIQVPDTRLALPDLAKDFYGDPSKDLFLAGVTGTNGKTSTVYWLEYLLERAGKKTGVIGTVRYGVGEKQIPATRTTPGRLETERLLSEIKREGAAAAVMEVSSHALEQERVAGLHFDAAVFTNLTRDHLDYHLDMESYFKAKKKLFSSVLQNSKKNIKTCLINRDDSFGQRLWNKVEGNKVSFGLKAGSDISVSDVKSDLRGSAFYLKTGGKESVQVHIPLTGNHNICNFLGAVSVLSAYGFDVRNLLREPLDVRIPGRLERIALKNGGSVFIDYAHTADGLENALASLKPHVRGNLIVVFGCGGDRDQGKRRPMGRAAARWGDEILLTSDNPRGEDPEKILQEIVSGFDPATRYEIETDREKAIQRSIRAAGPEDVVLIAGKGHESEQIFNDKVIAFSDKECVQYYAQLK